MRQEDDPVMSGRGMPVLVTGASGLMGFNSSEENVDRLLNLFDTELKKYSIFESSTF